MAILIDQISLLRIIDVNSVLVAHPMRRKHHNGLRLHSLGDLTTNLLEDWIYGMSDVVLHIWLPRWSEFKS